MPGVLLVLTGDDVKADGLGDVPCHAPLNNRDGSPRHDTPRPALAIGKVRHLGQPVALVVAETLAQAQDAAEAIEIDYEHAARRDRRARRAGDRRAAAVRLAFPAILCSTGTTIPRTSPRPMRLSPRPRTSPRSSSSTTAWS